MMRSASPPIDRRVSLSFLFVNKRKLIFLWRDPEITVARPRKFFRARACVPRMSERRPGRRPRGSPFRSGEFSCWADNRRISRAPGKRRGGVPAGTWPPLRSIRISTVPSPRHFENGQAVPAIDIADGASRVARGTSRTSASHSSFPRTSPCALLVAAKSGRVESNRVESSRDGSRVESNRHTFRDSHRHRVRPNERTIPPKNRPVVTPS